MYVLNKLKQSSGKGFWSEMIYEAMAFFGIQLFPEKDNRPVILLRYASEVTESNLEIINAELCKCKAVKKNKAQHYFFVMCSAMNFEIIVHYDDERYWYVVDAIRSIGIKQGPSIDLDKVNYIERDLLIAIRPEEKTYKYRNPLSAMTTSEFYSEVEQLENYDAKVEELKRIEEIRIRKEKEDEEAALQLKIWKNYVERKLSLLKEAGRPFVATNKQLVISGKHVDIEVSSHYDKIAEEEDLEELAMEYNYSIDDGKLHMTLEQFKDFRQNVLDEQIQITDDIICSLNVLCDGHWDARNFKNENQYGRELFYGQYSNGRITLTFKSKEIDSVFSFYEKVCNSFYFTNVDGYDLAKVKFCLRIRVSETNEQRQQRIKLLSGIDFYTDRNKDKGVYLGTLARGDFGKSIIRISFPRDAEQRKAVKEYLRTIKPNTLKIYPWIERETELLEREKRAIYNICWGKDLKNDNIKNFIFNSSRARPIDIFAGLTSKQIASTSEYHDCAYSRLLPLNPSQQEAVVKALYAHDLCLLQGPPGTGKTTVISELIWQHIRKNQYVRMMLTSQTNLAIDNALNRLFGSFDIQNSTNSWRNLMLIKPLRVADSEVVEDEGKPFTLEEIDSWKKGESDGDNIVARWMRHISQRIPDHTQYFDLLEEWRDSLNAPSAALKETFADRYIADYNILCMTCGKVGSSAFRRNRGPEGFDVVIVDEASKATPPELLMPLCYAQKSIVIGDHRQLPPLLFESEFFKKVAEIDPELVNNLDGEFRKSIIEESLFKRLITHPFLSSSIKATFNEQYRMHPKINAAISQFYSEDEGGLYCGLNPNNVDRPDFEDVSSRYHGLSFGDFIQPDIHTIWVDVPDGMELGEDNSSYNEKEAYVVRLVLEALFRANGFNRYFDFWTNHPSMELRNIEGRIGLISFYKAQVNQIKKETDSFCDRNHIKRTVKSVDRYQGQESGIVIVSTVKSYKRGFTKTPERLNVALSRARRLLIIVGNSKFFGSDRAATDDGKLIYRNVIDVIKSTGVFINYHELEKLLGYER